MASIKIRNFFDEFHCKTSAQAVALTTMTIQQTSGLTRASVHFYFLFLAGLFLILLGSSFSARADAYDDFVRAVKFNDVSTVQNLLAQGMDANAINGTRGETVLMIALREKSAKVFELLLKHPDIKLETHATNGDTAIMIASFLGDLNAVNQLLTAGARVSQPGWTALHYASAAGHVELMSLFLKKGALVNALSPNKTTSLMMAVSSGKKEAIQVLLDGGADATLINEMGLSALDFSIQLEQREIERLLRQR
jgi:ankyrin repeat protein